MDQISSFLGSRTQPKAAPASERAELIGYFTDEVNKERDGKQWKKVTPRYIAVRLAHIKSLSDLYYMKNICEDYRDRGKSFSKCFFGSLKAKPNDA